MKKMVEYMKKMSLPILINRWLKKNTERANIKYADSQDILIIFTAEGNEKMKAVRSLQSKFEKDNKRVSFLYLQLDENSKPDVGLDEGMVKVDKSEFSFMGDVKNKQAIREIANSYDFLVHADMDSNMYTDLILSSSKAKCRVGRYQGERHLFYDLMVNIGGDQKLDYLYDQLYHYTSSI